MKNFILLLTVFLLFGCQCKSINTTLSLNEFSDENTIIEANFFYEFLENGGKSEISDAYAKSAVFALQQEDCIKNDNNCYVLCDGEERNCGENTLEGKVSGVRPKGPCGDLSVCIGFTNKIKWLILEANVQRFTLQAIEKNGENISKQSYTKLDMRKIQGVDNYLAIKLPAKVSYSQNLGNLKITKQIRNFNYGYQIGNSD